MKRKFGLVYCLLFAFLLAGCSIPQEQVNEIVVGETTKSEIIEWFGKPDRRSNTSGGSESFTYSKVSFLKVYKVEGDMLIIHFSGDIVKSYHYSDGN